MSKIDEMIREALKCEEKQVLRDDQELSFFALSMRQFTGVNGWVTWVIMIFQTIFFAVGAICMIRLFLTNDVLPALKWGISGATALIVSLQLKLSLMPQMQADRIMREIRRLELRLTAPRS